jgi:uncharacterized protein (TIGR02996 family)
MHDEFLTALRENPKDDVTRLVYADWLDEQDDPLAEFLRLEVRLAAGVSDDERRAMMNRLVELGRRTDFGWLRAVNRSPFVRCVLRKKSGVSPLEGALELATYATRALLVAFDAHLLEHLRFKITDPLGGLSDEWYEKFPNQLRSGAPNHFRSRAQYRLNPGERLSIGVNLLNTIPAREVMVGAYTVEAVYDYDGVQSRADPVRVELTDEDRRRWGLGRFARG